jgi:hypothetical protein
MDLAGRMAAAALLIFAAAQAIPVANAAPHAKQGCWRAELYGKACTSLRHRRMAKLGRHRAKLYRGDESAIAQLSPRLQPRRISSLRFDRPGLCGRRAICLRERNLVEALVRAPDSSTEPLLRETGIPVIRDVPPIVILRPDPERRHFTDLPR